MIQDPRICQTSFQEITRRPGQPVDELAAVRDQGAILAKLRLAIGKDAGMATRHDWYKAAALRCATHRAHWLTTEKQSYDAGRQAGSIISAWNS